MSEVWTWFQDHSRMVMWLGGLAALVCVGGLLSVPWLVARIPEDYLSSGPPPHSTRVGPGHWWRWLLVIVKNVCGYLLICLGLAMLALPGPGLLTIVVGLLLVDIPRKRRLVRWLLFRPVLMKSVNWMRDLHGRPPLEPPKGPPVERVVKDGNLIS